MPPLGSASKSKTKHKDARHSRSRNTTPSSVLSGPAHSSSSIPTTTPFLQLDTTKLLVASHPSYADILERLETKPTNLEPKQLEDIIQQLRQLGDAAEKRVDSCEKAIRLIHEQLKELDSEHKERERQAEQTRRSKSTKLKKEDSSTQKVSKDKKRKDRDRDTTDVEIKREGKYPVIHMRQPHN